MVIVSEVRGGPEETRTPDLYSAIVALSQLSYRPSNFLYSLAGGPEGTRTPDLYSAIVALSQLSYRPEGKRYVILAILHCQA